MRRYYQPIRELTKAGPPLCDLGNDEAVKAHRPLSCPDRALTAFCQLGALRLQTRRALLFFFDSSKAYVLAEATRTLSLQNDTIHADQDDLWLGHTIIPRGYSVCEHTINLPANEGTNKQDPNSSVVHIINDLSGDTRFCDRAFVTGGPKARFYAGVPITTPKGINIGAYCVLDDRKRDGLDEDGVNFLRDMAATVMTHLEMVRATAEHKIGTQMIAGLGAFIDGASGFRDWAAQNGDFGLDEDPNISHPLRVQPMTTAASAVGKAAVQVGEHLTETARLQVLGPSVRRLKGRPGLSASHSSPVLQHKTSASLRAKMSTEDFDLDPSAAHARKTFDRAANLVREAMSVDGVVFLDAAVGTFGGLVETPESTGNTEQSSDCNGSAAEATTGTEGEDNVAKKSTDNDVPKSCQILASSSASLATSEGEKVLHAMKQRNGLTEKFLRSLLRRYPRGRIWSFDENGDASSEDESSEYSTEVSTCSCSPDSSTKDGQGHNASCPKRRKRSRLDDCKEIQRLFPGVRSVGLVGMWDHTRQRWYAASIFWSYSPLRLFSEESEVKYMAAFCDVILAELHRLEAQTSDRAKSDFISTISHELRSPLHGILGSVECLQEQPTDNFSAGLISQVEICGRTLLDIVDHLLDFSKINHQSKSRVSTNPDGSSDRLTSKGSKRTRLGGMMALDADVALDHVTEEVVETAVYSFCCSRGTEVIMNRKVAVILDIDRISDFDWRFHVPLGAWKRVCINLVSNALKYTNKGHIKIALKANALPDKKKRSQVTFTVTDTGRGMSRDFMENHLFRAFAQEDSLIEGTGLGMNLVAKIVKSFDGKIEVNSEQGVGSSFSITVPLERSTRGRESTSRNSYIALERSIAGTSIGVIENSSTPLASNGEVPDETIQTHLLASLHRTLSQVGAKAMQCTWTGDETVDMYLVTEGELNAELKRRQDMGCADTLMSPCAVSNKPFIVLCDSTLSARKLRTPGLGNIATGHVELIAQPAGPDRLVKAVASCLRNKEIVAQATSIAGAVKDIPAMVPHPDRGGSPSTTPHKDIPIRGRKEVSAHSSNTSLRINPSDDSISDTSTLLGTDAGTEVGLASDEYRFPRVPTPALNGSMPRLDEAPKAKPISKKADQRNGGVSLLLVDDNVSFAAAFEG